MRNADPRELFERALGGDRAALARLLSMVEQGGDQAREIGRIAYGVIGRRSVDGVEARGAAVVGITGAPGAGKSTLTSGLIGRIREDNSEVAVVAVDPSSPSSGGAILGDRVRMDVHSADEGVFIRSMATRGQLGGLTSAVPEAIGVLGAVGFPWILIETVGVGQVGVDIVGHADTTVVVVNPGWGDAIQANKAGLMEIGDIFVVNKADRPGVAETVRDLERMLALSPRLGWSPPVVPTVATTGDGTDELWAALLQHREFLAESGGLERLCSEKAGDAIHRILAERMLERARELGSGESFEVVLGAVVEGKLDPWAAADRLLDTGGGS